MGIVATFPDVRFGPGDPPRFRLRDVKTMGRRAKTYTDRVLFRMFEQLPMEIRCQQADTEVFEQEEVQTRRDGDSGAWDAVKVLRLTEAQCHGDVEPVTMVMVDTQNANEFVGAWQWYNIVLTSPTRLRMRPWPIFPLKGRAITPAQIGRWSVDVIETLLTLPAFDVGGTPVNVGDIRTYTFPAGSIPTKRDAELAAYEAEIDARGADPRSPLTVSVTGTAWGGEDRQITWQPRG